MAHIFDIAPEVSLPDEPLYKDGRLHKENHVQFPKTPVFASMNQPARFEGTILSLEHTGTIPPEINGTFFRVQPDHRFPPMFEDDIHFNGDGSVTAIRIFDGKVDFRQRYVHTERYKAETKARKSLFGRYRNPWTDNESVKGVIRTASNTNVFFWRGMLLATKEDGPPYAMDPITLETYGRYDFEGQILSPTFTAHPKFDPRTGEMVCFAYEAGGDGADCSREVVVWTLDKEGRKVSERRFEAPFAGMIHDCGLSENWLVLPLTPIKMDLERMKKGGNKFAWDPKEDQVYGLVPRRGDGEVKWFRGENGMSPTPTSVSDSKLTNFSAFHGHVAGCYENAQGHVVVDLTVADGNVFFWFPPDGEEEGQVAKRNKLSSPTHRWILDPSLPNNARITPALVWPTNGEFSRIDDRWTTRKYKHFWLAKVDPSRPYDFAKCGPPAGGLFNCLGHYTWDLDDELATGEEDVYFAGPTCTFQEPTFIPKGDKEGEGWLIALVNHLDVLRNDVVILDAQNLSKGPVATIHLPLKLKLGLHGNWVDWRDIEEWTARRQEGGEVGPVRVATEMLPWQKAFWEKEKASNGVGIDGTNANGTNGASGTNGVNGSSH